MDRFLIDECLSADLVAIAKARGYDASHVSYLGKAGWQDWNLVSHAVDNDYIVVTPRLCPEETARLSPRSSAGHVR
jgi:predicted nuclease of predicted toxin-antitoxin system